MKKRATWREKLERSNGLPKVQTMSGRMAEKWGDGPMVIPAPLEVDAIMREVPVGRLITIQEIRDRLAKSHAAALACPITTGIFAWIAAHAADEAALAGVKDPTPYWRTLKTGGELNAKYPGGIEALKRKLRAEGHVVIQKGKRFFVKDYERSVI